MATVTDPRPASGALLVRDVRLVPLDGEAPGDPVDVRIVDGAIDEIGARLATAGEPVLAGGGRWVIPGLWDQHVHFVQAVRASLWVGVAGTAGPGAVTDILAARIAELTDPTALVVGFGYRSATWAEPARTAQLDEISGDHPVVVIAGDAHNGWLNSRAQELLGVGPYPGAIAEAEWFGIFARLAELPGFDPTPAQLSAYLDDVAALGVTGLVDLEFSDAFMDWPARVAAGLRHVRVRAGVYPHQLEAAIEAGLRTGDLLDDAGLVEMGPLKVISDGSLSTRTAWCLQPYTDLDADDPAAHGAPNQTPAELRRLMARAAANGLEVAIHAIGDRANADVLDAFAETGARGSVEHAQLLASADMGRFRELGLTASVQPPHLLDDRPTVAQCWSDRADRCYVVRTLLDDGTHVVFGSDAPVSPIGPWAAIADAVHRALPGEPSWEPQQRISPVEALRCSVDDQRIVVGGRGDLVLLGADPLAEGADTGETAARLRAMPVLATVCAGRVTFRADAAAEADAERG